MIFHTYQPNDQLLQLYIQTIWYISQDASDVIGMNPRMVPDGCYHMVINLGAPHFYIDKNGRGIEPKRSHINTKQTEFMTMERSGHVEIIGVVFKHHGFYPFVQIPVSELTGKILNMDDLIPAQFDLLEEQLALTPSVQDKFMVVERWLQSQFHKNTVIKSDLKQEIVFAGELISRSSGMIRVRELAKRLYLSERSLERHFKTYYGISPKQFADLHRIHNVLRCMHIESNKMIDYATMGEFYDQAHFTRVFKNMVGITPKIYLQNRDLLSDLYNTERQMSCTIKKH